ncbi:MAG TPA: hypothetical protein VGY98_06005, partial [Verrucomicrobiae bacterium]|nr:hypothetical protein [Verrucomicrobiae bacterium]
MKKTIILLLGISLIGGLNWRSKFVSLEDAAGNHRRFRVSKNGFEPTVEAAPAILSIAPKSVSALSAEKPSSVVLGRSEIVRKVAPENSGANSAGTERYQLLRELRAWAATNTEAALAVVLKLPTGNDRDKELAAVCFGLAQSDPADAVKLAQAFHLDQQAGAVIENLTQQWAQSDVTSALTWAVNQPPGDAR